MWEFMVESHLDILQIIVLERSVTRLMEMDQERHNFARVHFVGMMTSLPPIADRPLFPLLTMSLPEIIDITKQIEYPHLSTS
jgi:hypothetical protein